MMSKRIHVVDAMKRVFVRYGFEPLETPAFERIETLMGKYGDEGEQLIYKILKRGKGGDLGEVDLALRYDLTVPLARVIAMNPALKMPFKRYQTQPVWRADRPQKGRFREFVQCDVDTLGTSSMLADAECLAVLHDCLVELGFSAFTIRLNHRGLLRAIVDAAGLSDLETTVLIAVDKLDKIGREGVDRELAGFGISSDAIEKLWSMFSLRGEGALDEIASSLGDSGAAAIADLRELVAYALAMGVSPERLQFDPVLARGLGYYTGPVFEAEVVEPKIGSIAGGGRYDGLVGVFSKRDVPAVGVSLGLDRVVTVMEELGLLPERLSGSTVLVAVYSEELKSEAVRVATALRTGGVPTTMVLDRVGKLGKQFKGAHSAGIPWVAVVGPDDKESGLISLKEMSTGTQFSLTIAEVLEKLKG
tara:strand:+ start:464 stop:1720 length:1257 start_codon:yes stop_codon:yes gene_type:complete